MFSAPLPTSARCDSLPRAYAAPPLQVIGQLLGTPIDYEKVGKMVKDANFELTDLKAIVAALHFIVSSASKYAVAEDDLAAELQQLGLPKENSVSIAKPYRENQDKLRAACAAKTLQLQRISSVDWRVDCILASSAKKEINVPSVHMRLGFAPPPPDALAAPATAAAAPTAATGVAFEMDAERFRLFHAELRAAKALMEQAAE